MSSDETVQNDRLFPEREAESQGGSLEEVTPKLMSKRRLPEYQALRFMHFDLCGFPL